MAHQWALLAILTAASCVSVAAVSAILWNSHKIRTREMQLSPRAFELAPYVEIGSPSGRSQRRVSLEQVQQESPPGHSSAIAVVERWLPTLPERAILTPHEQRLSPTWSFPTVPSGVPERQVSSVPRICNSEGVVDERRTRPNTALSFSSTLAEVSSGFSSRSGSPDPVLSAPGKPSARVERQTHPILGVPFQQHGFSTATF